jgi:hypothetical protein
MVPDLSPSQLSALQTAIGAEPAVAAFLAAGDDGSIAAWFNEPDATVKAWRKSVPRDDLFAAMTVAKFDALSAGKRDAWRLMLDFAPIDFTRAKMRSAVTDAWGAADAAAILTDCTRAATKAEALFGGTDRTESTVTAKNLATEGALTASDVARALRG